MTDILSAGMPIESIHGSSTAVYTGSFCFDYMLQLSRDAECAPTYSGLSFGLSMLANRLSWFFDLRGPSISLDSACSSTAMAVDIACQSLRSGSCSMVSRSIESSSNRAASDKLGKGCRSGFKFGHFPRAVSLDVEYEFLVTRQPMLLV